jgi:hypothetical protein
MAGESRAVPDSGRGYTPEYRGCLSANIVRLLAE